MRIVVAAVGRIRGGAHAELFAEFSSRLPWPLEIVEVEERRAMPAIRRKASEAALLAARIPKGATLIALDERGKQLTSVEFAAKLRGWRDAGVQTLAFVIGGADGIAAELLRRAELTLSLGPMTWPHLLARVMLAEQLYRASTILAGHPYHRA